MLLSRVDTRVALFLGGHCAHHEDLTSSNDTHQQASCCNPCCGWQVLEETGYDIESLLNEADFIELNLEGKRNKLYIVAGLDPDSAQFAPKCKGVGLAYLCTLTAARASATGL